MQQKQMIILVALLIVIVVVAAVLLMGNKGPQTSGLGPTTSGNPAGGGTPAGDRTPAINESDPAFLDNAIAAGSPVECDISITTDSGTTTANVKIKYPKFKEAITAAGQQVTVISDGTSMYMNSPQMGTAWYKIELTEEMTVGMSPSQIRSNLEQATAGTTTNCRTATFIDSDFDLPPDAVVTDITALQGGASGTPN